MITPEPVADCLQADTESQQAFLQCLATGFSTYSYGDQRTGVLFLAKRTRPHCQRKYLTSIRERKP